MPHRKNAKGDIGGAKRFSDTYDMDNIYLSQEGWVYRHYKKADKSVWWDEIIVAGQVDPAATIHGVTNDDVLMTTPVDPPAVEKLGVNDPNAFETGDTYEDFRYSDHVGAPDKVTEFTYKNSSTTVTGSLVDRIDFQETSWSSINVGKPVYLQPDGTQVPSGWSGVSDPSQPFDETTGDPIIDPPDVDPEPVPPGPNPDGEYPTLPVHMDSPADDGDSDA